MVHGVEPPVATSDNALPVHAEFVLQQLADPAHRSGFAGQAMRKLAMLNRAAGLGDLKIPPQNSLDALKKDRRGQHSIRINDQWRLCYRWTPVGPENVEMVDYH